MHQIMEGDKTVSSGLDFLTSEANVNEISRHRTCWLHCVSSYKRILTRREARNLPAFEKTSPCILRAFPFPRQKRSERRKSVSKDVVSRRIEKLDSGAFASHLENLWRGFSKEKKNNFACLDALWFSLYLQKPYKDKVLEWIKKIDIFSKRYVLVPIICWMHWRLLIFCHFGESLNSEVKPPCILLLDSLEKSIPSSFEPDIKRFVFDIYRAEGRPEDENFVRKIPFLVPKVPQQENDKDCGNFVLYFISLFIESAPENFSINEQSEFMMENWFTTDGLELFCKELNSFEKPEKPPIPSPPAVKEASRAQKYGPRRPLSSRIHNRTHHTISRETLPIPPTILID